MVEILQVMYSASYQIRIEEAGTWDFVKFNKIMGPGESAG